MGIGELFEKGGGVMYVLLALSIYALGVVIYKGIQFYRAGIFYTAFIDPVLQKIKGGDRDHAMRALTDIPGPVARIMRVSLACVANRDMSQKSKEAEIARVGAADLRYLESHLRGLDMTANVSPLLGLLGTVMGMVDAFARLGAAGSRVDPSLLASGIWEALITTIGGLMIAIPAVAAHYVIDGMVEKVRATMKDVSVQILALEDEFKRNERELLRKKALEEEQARRAQEEEQRNVRYSPDKSSTLRLLNPRYTL